MEGSTFDLVAEGKLGIFELSKPLCSVCDGVLKTIEGVGVWEEWGLILEVPSWHRKSGWGLLCTRKTCCSASSGSKDGSWNVLQS